MINVVTDGYLTESGEGVLSTATNGYLLFISVFDKGAEVATFVVRGTESSSALGAVRDIVSSFSDGVMVSVSVVYGVDVDAYTVRGVSKLTKLVHE